jgi:hypothetical protein
MELINGNERFNEANTMNLIFKQNHGIKSLKMVVIINEFEIHQN